MSSRVFEFSRSRITPWLIGLCLAIAVGGCAPTQVLGDPETFKALDALWTAVTSRKTELVNQVDKELDRLASAGKLSSEGRAELRTISDTALKGQWESAAQSLRTFIKGQRPPK